MSAGTPSKAVAGRRRASPASARHGLLQRTCACGAAKGGIGEMCEECRSRRLQRKLAVGSDSDALEREADRVAVEVSAARLHPDTSRARIRIQRCSATADAGLDTAPASVDHALTG